MKACGLLAGSLTSWSSTGNERQITAAAGMHFAQNLGTLTGLTYLSLNYDEHIGDLAQLTALRKLHTCHICGWRQASPRVQHLTHLRELHIYGIHATELDLSCCTQLVRLHLEFDDPGPPLHRLVLPASPDVRLEHLELESTQVHMPLVLENLSLAHSITHICFSDVYLKNLREGDWPCSLAHLEGNYFVPQQLLGYPQLHDLFIEGYTSNHLPDCFSGLTQLRSLQMLGCSFHTFLVGVLNLSQLTRLAIMNLPALKIIKEMVKA